MESTPDSGVDIRKAEVAPLPAPLFLSVTAVGITEHEQSGRGIPTIDAFKTEAKLSLPNHFLIMAMGTK